MGELKDTEVYEEELIDYEEEDEKALDSTKPSTETVKKLVSFLSYPIHCFFVHNYLQLRFVVLLCLICFVNRV
jgi:hypothetical protein